MAVWQNKICQAFYHEAGKLAYDEMFYHATRIVKNVDYHEPFLLM